MALQQVRLHGEGLHVRPSDNCNQMEEEELQDNNNLSFPQIWVQSFCQSDCDAEEEDDGTTGTGNGSETGNGTGNAAAKASSKLVVRSLQSFHSLDSQDSGICAVSSSSAASTRQASFQSIPSSDEEAANGLRVEDEARAVEDEDEAIEDEAEVVEDEDNNLNETKIVEDETEARTEVAEDEHTFFPTKTSRAIDAWLKQIGLNGFDVSLLQQAQDEDYDSEDDSDSDEEDEAEDEDCVYIRDPYEVLTVEAIAEVEGKTDAASGMPVGNCTVKMKNGSELFGNFRNGRRSGRGSLGTPGALVCVRGFYRQGVISGQGRATLLARSFWPSVPSAVHLEGVFVDGRLHGPVRGMDEGGGLVFVGAFRRGKPSGNCWLYHGGQGWLYGCVDRRGRFNGHDIVYVYPDRFTCLVGTFRNEVLHKAVAGTIVDAKLNSDHIMCLKTAHRSPEPAISDTVESESAESLEAAGFFSFCPSDKSQIRCNWLLPDPMETRLVSCSSSSVPEGGDGLFAAADLPAASVVGYYNGLRLLPSDNHASTTNSNYQIYVDWGNTDASEYIDLPIEAVNVTAYASSLSHKANHSFVPNCQYVAVEHPRFGRVPALKTLVDLKRGQELFCHYKYDMALAPNWYHEAWQGFVSNNNNDSHVHDYDVSHNNDNHVHDYDVIHNNDNHVHDYDVSHNNDSHVKDDEDKVQFGNGSQGELQSGIPEEGVKGEPIVTADAQNQSPPDNAQDDGASNQVQE